MEYIKLLHALKKDCKDFEQCFIVFELCYENCDFKEEVNKKKLVKTMLKNAKDSIAVNINCIDDCINSVVENKEFITLEMYFGLLELCKTLAQSMRALNSMFLGSNLIGADLINRYDPQEE